MQTSMLNQDVGVKTADFLGSLEAASDKDAQVAKAESSHDPQIMGSNPGELSLPKFHALILACTCDSLLSTTLCFAMYATHHWSPIGMRTGSAS